MQQRPNEPETIEQIQQRLVVLWGALLTSQFVFLLVLYTTKRQLFAFDLSGPLGGTNSIMVSMLAILALTSFSLSFVIGSQLRKKAEDEQNVAIVQTAMIISCALCESISLLGFLLAFLIEYPFFFLWFALGIFGILLHFPQKKYLLRATYKKSQTLAQEDDI
jgi:F0F1-type ATP synthase membrane subunit c/vacuolar-type H+-ATPase subunit K